MTEQVRIDPKIAAHIDAALAAGFTIYARQGRDPRPVGHVYVCKEWDGPFALIQVPTHTWDPVNVDVPIEPHKDYGSSVLVDHDGTPAGVVAALEKACTEPTVTVRFMSRQYVAKHGVVRVPNYGNNAVTKYGRSADDVVTLGGRGTNWVVPQLADRLEVGDRFIFDGAVDGDGDVVTVEAKRYGGGYGYENTIITATDGRTISLPQRTFVTLVGAA